MATTSKQLHQEMMRNFVIERLIKMGVRQAQSGKSVHEMDYEEAKYELVLASFREIDTENPSNGWF
jgi:hypothetical protein